MYAFSKIGSIEMDTELNVLSDETIQNWNDFDSNLDGSMMRVVVFGAPLIIDIIESI